MILARKYLANGMIDIFLFSLHISVYKFLAFVLSFDRIPWIVFVQAMILGSGELAQNVPVLYTHTKTTLISSSAPLAFAFDGSIILSLVTGSF